MLYFLKLLLECWGSVSLSPGRCCSQGGNIPLAALQLSCSTLGSPVVLELSLPGSSARGSAGGAMSVKVAVASPAIHQDQLTCRSFSFIVPGTKRRSLSLCLHPCPLFPLALFFMVRMVHLSIWIWLILLGFFHWKISRMPFKWPNQTLLC